MKTMRTMKTMKRRPGIAGSVEFSFVAACIVLVTATAANGQNYTPINVNLHVDQAQLDQALAAPVVLKYQDTPLREVLSELAQRIGMPIFIDSRGLAEAAISTDSPVTIATPPIRVEAALELLLDEQDLMWVPGSGGFIITTPEAAEQKLITRVYPVYDLVSIKSGPNRGVDFDSLIDVLWNAIDPDEWEVNGGNGVIEPFNGSLVISQTWQIHRKVEQALAALRGAEAQAPGEWSTVVRYQANAYSHSKAKPRPSTFMFPVPAGAIRTHE